MFACENPKRKSSNVLQNQQLLRLRLSYQERMYYSNLFKLYQDNKTGNVNLENFPKLLGIFGTDIAEDIAKRIFEILSGNKDYVNLNEYLKYIDVYHYGDEAERCNITCKLMDYDKSGNISLSNFTQYINLIIGAVRKVNPGLKSDLFTEEDIEILFNKISNNKNYFTYEEFATIYNEKPELLSWVDYFKNDSNDIILIIHKNIKKIIKNLYNFNYQINNLIKEYRHKNYDNKENKLDKNKDIFELLTKFQNIFKDLKTNIKIQNEKFMKYARNNQISLRNLFSILSDQVIKEQEEYDSYSDNNEEESKEQEKSKNIFSDKKNKINPINLFNTEKVKKNQNINNFGEELKNRNNLKRISTIRNFFLDIKKNLNLELNLNKKNNIKRQSLQLRKIILNKSFAEKNEEKNLEQNYMISSTNNINNDEDNDNINDNDNDDDKSKDSSDFSDFIIMEENEEDKNEFNKNITRLQSQFNLKNKICLDKGSSNILLQNTNDIKSTKKLGIKLEENKQNNEENKSLKDSNGNILKENISQKISSILTDGKDEKCIQYIDKLLKCLESTSKIFFKSLINLNESYKWIESRYLKKTILNIQKIKKEENKKNIINKNKNEENKNKDNNKLKSIALKNIPKNKLKTTDESFKILLNTIMGIQIAVESSPDISEIQNVKQYLNSMTYSIQTANLSKNKQEIFMIKEYAGIIFNSIRKLYGYDKESFIQSISPQVFITEMIISNTTSIEELFNTGSSGSLFYYTRDGKFILKTISKSEYKTLKTILPKYYSHLLKYKNTLLPKFFGCYKLIKKIKKKKLHVYFIIMMNVFSTSKQIHVRFDLKGSTLGREVLSKKDKTNKSFDDILGKYSFALKDLDFDYFKKNIYIDENICNELIEQLNADSLLLKECNINDYSLLLGIHKKNFINNINSSNDLQNNEINTEINATQLYYSDNDNNDENISTNRKLKGGYSNECLSITSINSYNTFRNNSDEKTNNKETFYKSKNDNREIILDDNGIYNEKKREIYYMGIIDILTSYGGLKICEFCYKSIRYCTNKMSCISPGKYQERFINYLKQKILPNNQDLEIIETDNVNKLNTFDEDKKVYKNNKLSIDLNEDNLSSKNKSEVILKKTEKIFDNIIN